MRRALRPRSASYKAGRAKVVFEVFVERFAEMRSVGAVRSCRERDESTNLVCGEIDRYFCHVLLHLTIMLPPTGIRVNPLGLPGLPDLTLRDAVSPPASWVKVQERGGNEYATRSFGLNPNRRPDFP